MLSALLLLITWEVMGAKHDKVKKHKAKGGVRGEILQQYYYTAYIYTMSILNVRANCMHVWFSVQIDLSMTFKNYVA